VTPEGDQRVHPPPVVNLPDIRSGVAKFYKEVVNAKWARVLGE
jgi:hypothetical protein